MTNPFAHVELNTTDVAKAKGFYGKLFGWKLEDVPKQNMTYTMIGVGEGAGGGNETDDPRRSVLLDGVRAARRRRRRDQKGQVVGRNGDEGGTLWVPPLATGTTSCG
jgi:predicted enzyme related to lactoylglutathione lyase